MDGYVIIQVPSYTLPPHARAAATAFHGKHVLNNGNSPELKPDLVSLVSSFESRIYHISMSARRISTYKLGMSDRTPKLRFKHQDT